MDKEPQVARLAYIIYSLLENNDLSYLSTLTSIPIEKIELWKNKFSWEHRPLHLFQNPEVIKSVNPDNVIINFFNQLINKIENSNEIIDSLEIDEVLKLLSSLSRIIPSINKFNSNGNNADVLLKEDEKFIENIIAKPSALELAHKLLSIVNG